MQEFVRKVLCIAFHALPRATLLLGEAELERFSDTEIKAFEDAAQVRRPVNYVELLNELRTASLVIAHDTGPAHLAGIIGVPTLSLFGPSNPNVWKPLGPRVKVLYKQPLDDLTVDEVLAAAG